jgi:hypothetical protein
MKGTNAHAEPFMVMENPAAILHVDKNLGDDRARRQLCPQALNIFFLGLQVEHNGDISCLSA